MQQYEVGVTGSLQELLQTADFVSMHVPLSPATQAMFTEPHFHAMKPTAIFISTGRGPTVERKGPDQGASGRMDCRSRP